MSVCFNIFHSFRRRTKSSSDDSNITNLTKYYDCDNIWRASNSKTSRVRIDPSGTIWQVPVAVNSTMVQMTHGEGGHLKSAMWKWKWEATWGNWPEGCWRWRLYRATFLAQTTEEPWEGGEDDCFAWSTVCAEYFSFPQTSQKITCTSFSFTHCWMNYCE